MIRRLLTVLGLVLLLTSARTSAVDAQYIFADSDGDGRASGADGLRASGPTSLDIWLQTDRQRDGSTAPTGTSGSVNGIFGYELVLKAVGGTVKWGGYTNLQSSMSLVFGQVESPTEFRVGYVGFEALPPGKYHLGRLRIEVVSGDPSLEFAAQSSLRHGGVTAFASTNPGRDSDHYLKFNATLDKTGEFGDWADADGLRAPSLTIQAAAAAGQRDVPERFAARLTTSTGTRPQLTVTTTRDGYVRVQVYDVRGRLLSTVERGTVNPGRHVVDLSRRGVEGEGLPSGIYFYRVEATEGELRGRFVILK